MFDLGAETEFRLEADGPDRQLLRLIARRTTGHDDKTWTLAVAADTSSLTEEVNSFRQTLLLSSAILAFSMLDAAVLMLRAALSPLHILRQAVINRHADESKKIGGSFPSEVQPLVDDLNTLLERNERLREKGRVQVANLAHALKTPAAILRNELTKARRGEQMNVELADEAIENVSAAADRHLSLTTAGPDEKPTGELVDVVPVVKEIIRALTRLFIEKEFRLSAPEQLPIPRSRPKQLEVFGNLLENAGKWSTRERQENHRGRRWCGRPGR